MSKFKAGDRVIYIGEAEYFGFIKGEQYTVRNFYPDNYLSIYDYNGYWSTDFFEIAPLAKDDIVSIELTHEQLLILYSLVASTTISCAASVYFTLKRKLEKIHGREMLMPENLRLPTYVLNYDCNEKMKNFVKTFFPEPKSEQQLEYDKLQEKIRLLQQQAEKLNPSKSGGL